MIFNATIVIYGIPNCDTVKQARRWLDAHGVPYTFHDFKKDGLTSALLDSWLTAVSAATLINRRGTAWRRLSDAQRAAANTDAGALALMLAQPSLIKRPVVMIDGRLAAVGFDPEQFAACF